MDEENCYQKKKEKIVIFLLCFDYFDDFLIDSCIKIYILWMKSNYDIVI